MAAAFNEELTKFSTAYKKILADTMDVDGYFEKALSKVAAQFDNMGITNAEQAKHLSSMATTMAVNIASSGQQTAVSLLMHPYKADLTARQTAGFDDKLRIDKAKTLGEALGMTSNATGSIDAALSTKYSAAIDAIVPAVV